MSARAQARLARQQRKAERQARRELDRISTRSKTDIVEEKIDDYIIEFDAPIVEHIYPDENPKRQLLH